MSLITDVIENHKNAFSAGESLEYLVVTRGGRLSAVSPVTGESADGPVYVMDCDETLRLNLLESLGLAVFNIGEKHGKGAVTILRQLLGQRLRSISTTPLSVMVDGISFDPDPTLKSLITTNTEWLKTLAVLTLEFRSQLLTHRSEKTKQNVIRRLGQIRLKRAQTVSVQIDGLNSPLPVSAGGVIAVEHDHYPSLIIHKYTDDPTWRTLEVIAEPLARLIGHSSLAVPLRLVIVLLARQRDDEDLSNPSDAEFALAFGEQEERVREIRHSLKGSLFMLLENLRPVLCHCFGPRIVEQFNDKHEELSTEDSILLMLRGLTNKEEGELKDIITACREEDKLSDLRDRLGISYSDFNQALSALGPPYHPIWNIQAHTNAFTYFKQQNRDAILSSLRHRFLGDFKAGNPLTEYAGLKSLDSLVPDPIWLDSYDTPGETLLVKKTNSWLAQIEAVPLESLKTDLPPFDEVRRENSKTVDTVTQQVADVFSVWRWKNAAQLPGVWLSSDPSAQLRGMAEADCLLDFEKLDARQVLSWLFRKGLWPSGMPLSLNLDDLGLTIQDVKDHAKQIEALKNKRDTDRRSITIGGKLMLAEPEQYASIAELVAASLTPAFLLSPRRMAKLQGLDANINRGGSGGIGWGGSGSTRASEQQRNGVGLAGEVLAFQWLKHHYREAVTDDSWKSKYKNYVLGGSTGNDSLGYDFEVVLKRGTLLFEVKSSASDRMEIEMGESEVDQAQRNQANNRYRILYIGNVLNPARAFLHVLPNPFSKRGRGLFRLAGTGLRYQFKLRT